MQWALFRGVIMNVIRRQNGQALRLGQIIKTVDPGPIIAVIKVAGRDML